MSAAEMRAVAAKLAQQMADSGHPFIGLDYHDAILSLPIPDDEGMVERAARAIAAVYGLDDFAPFYEDARTVIRVINGGKP